MKKKQNAIYLNIAGFNIKLIFYSFLRQKNFSINNLKKRIINLFKGFIAKTEPKCTDFKIKFYKRIPNIIEKKINNRNTYFLYLYEQNDNEIRTFQHISINQFVFILIRLLQQLVVKNGFILHSSASLINNKACLFIGPSGAGKSTIINLLKQNYVPIADDSVIIREKDGKFFLYQTPVIEKNYWIKKSNQKFEIGKIYILKKAKNFKIIKINNPKYIIQLLLKQLWTTPDDVRAQINIFYKFIEGFHHFYLLHFVNNNKQALEFFKKID
jgi:hypothetical protein